MLYFADIGELGWSLYLSAHVRWLAKHGKDVVVATSPARQCLYQDLAAVVPLLPSFGKKYGQYSQDGFGLYGVSCLELKQYFQSIIPRDYNIPRYFDFRCRRLSDDQLLYASYTSSSTSDKQSRILVFPRCRKTFYPKEDLKYKHPNHHEKRNLPCLFYKLLVVRLCTEFPDDTITCVGTSSGAYNIDNVNISNYSNLVGRTKSLQELVDMCVYARAAIGGTSAPPKISMLQGVPTAIIGHEENRFVVEENWMKTRCMFWPIELSQYGEFKDDTCIDEIVEFVRGDDKCQKS